MRYLFVLLVVYAGMALSMATAAENQTGYTLGAEDVIVITVQKHAEYSGQYLIPSDGILQLPAVGPMNANGLTLTQLTNALVTAYGQILKKPEISVSLNAMRMQRIYVVGAVERPGIYDLKQGWRIIEALAAAGGLVGDPYHAHVDILHSTSNKQTTVDVAAVLKADPAANCLLEGGDVLTIETVESQPIYVTGEVKTPGMYNLKTGARVAEALVQAGGLTVPENEARATLLRADRDVMPLDLKQIMSGDANANITLQRGDVIKLEALRSTRVTIMGQIKTPGAYQVKDGDSALEVIALAGGPLENAELAHATVVRASGTVEVFDLAPALLQGHVDTIFPVHNGDMLIIPVATARVAILGFVNEPGYYPLREGQTLTLADALSQAKGMDNKRSGLSQVAILRTRDGKQERLLINFADFIKKGNTAQNPVLQAGDIVFVPETKRPDWNFIFTGLASLSTAVLAAR